MLGLFDPAGQFLNAFEYRLGRQCRWAARDVVLARGFVIAPLVATFFAGGIRILSVVAISLIGIRTLRAQFFRCRSQDRLGKPATDIDALLAGGNFRCLARFRVDALYAPG